MLVTVTVCIVCVAVSVTIVRCGDPFARPRAAFNFMDESIDTVSSPTVFDHQDQYSSTYGEIVAVCIPQFHKVPIWFPAGISVFLNSKRS